MSADDAKRCWRRGFIGPAQWPWLALLRRLNVLNLTDGVFRDEWLARHADVLALDPDRELREQVAGDVKAPPSALVLLARDPDIRIRALVAQNPATPSDALEALASEERDEESDLALWPRYLVGANPAASIDLLEMLAKDSSGDVRCQVGSNPRVPERLLEVFANLDPAVRGGVAQNPAAPVRLLQLLAADAVEWVRVDVAANPSSARAPCWMLWLRMRTSG